MTKNSRATVRRINGASFLRKKVYDLADSSCFQPTVQLEVATQDAVEKRGRRSRLKAKEEQLQSKDANFLIRRQENSKVLVSWTLRKLEAARNLRVDRLRIVRRNHMPGSELNTPDDGKVLYDLLVSRHVNPDLTTMPEEKLVRPGQAQALDDSRNRIGLRSRSSSFALHRTVRQPSSRTRR